MYSAQGLNYSPNQARKTKQGDIIMDKVAASGMGLGIAQYRRFICNIIMDKLTDSEMGLGIVQYRRLICNNSVLVVLVEG